MDDLLIIRQPKTKQEFELMYDLRWRYLRQPWNQPRGSERDQEESIAIPLIALSDNKIIGTVRYQRINENVARARYLVVEKKFRGKGVGRRLMESIHMTAKNQNISYIILNARSIAKKFFEKLGYKAIEKGPLLFSEINHYKMVKKIKKNNNKLKYLIDNLKKL